MLTATTTKRIAAFIQRVSKASPALKQVLSTARITAIDARSARTTSTPNSAHFSEVSPGVGRRPPHLVLLNDSNEGAIPKDQWAVVQGLSDFLKVPASQVIILTQNEAFGSHSSDSDGEPTVNWSVSNRQFHMAIRRTASTPSLDQTWKASPDNYSSRFLCLNNAPKSHRIAVLAILTKKGLLEGSEVSFHLNLKQSGKSVATFVDQARARFPDLADDIDEFMAATTSPLRLEENFNRNNYWDLPPVAWKCLWFLVTESNYGPAKPRHPVRRVTEKSMKALVFGRPFVMVGNPLTLEYLHELGFATYERIVDERYDQILNPQARMAAIGETIQTLSATPLTRGLLAELRGVAEHNRRWLLDGFSREVVSREARSFEAAVDRSGL